MPVKVNVCGLLEPVTGFGLMLLSVGAGLPDALTVMVLVYSLSFSLLSAIAPDYIVFTRRVWVPALSVPIE